MAGRCMEWPGIITGSVDQKGDMCLYMAINITMELMCCLVLSVIIFSVLRKGNKTRQDTLFLWTLIFNTLAIFADVLAWSFNKMPGGFYRFLTQAGNFLSFSAGSFGHLCFMAYIIIAASHKTGSPSPGGRGFLWAQGIIAGTTFALLAVNLSSGMLYSIDEGNRFHWGEGIAVVYLLTASGEVLLMGQIIRCRKALERRDMWVFLSYGILPLLAIASGIWQTKIMLTGPSVMVSILLIFINVQQEQEQRLAQRELELADSRAAIMLSQIQPHFLFNALVSIQDLCRQDADRAEAAIHDFAKYLRGNMDSLSQKGTIPFRSELEHVRIYLSLEQMRFEERLCAEFDIQAADFFLPALTLQPIVENAVRYGVMKRVTGGTVAVRTREEAGSFRIIVEDDGIGFDPAEEKKDGRTHTGIDNVRRRLAAMCGGTLEIQSAPGMGTRAVLSIPKGGGTG